MIDLHLHTTASDGRCAPEELVRRAWGAGVTVLSVTDHDTTEATAAVRAAAARYGIETVTGIEITAVWEGRDVHVLGYFLDTASPVLQAFLDAQREDRLRRARAMLDRLAVLGCAIDRASVLPPEAAGGGRSVGRPHVARALVRAGHVPSVEAAFERYLGEGRPAFVSRRGTPPADVVRLIHDAGGIASLAHPGWLRRDDLVPGLAAAGLAAIEVYHCDHPPDLTRHYLRLARSLGLAVTGGSDYHGDSPGRPPSLGVVHLPPAEFEGLRLRAASRGERPES